MSEILATLHVSTARRVAGISALVVFALLLLVIVLIRPPSGLIGKVFLVGLGGVALIWAHKMYGATQIRLELTKTELRNSDGMILAKIEDISGVEHGAFAFKPSSGFLVKLNKPAPRAWAPGVWWRFGRNIGVGGVTNAREGKYMAEILTALLLERR